MDIERIKEFVTGELTDNLEKGYSFHNLDRARDLVSDTIRILEGEGNRADRDVTLAAAWLLFVGFTKDYGNHIGHSQEIAETFLSEDGSTGKEISRITALIASAWSEREPESEEEKVLRDARTAYYGSEGFVEIIELERLEAINIVGQAALASEFREKYLETLSGRHRFYTEYARNNWNEQRKENIISLVGKLLKAKRTENKERLKVKLKNQSPERAIQSLYRTQLRNHIKLSDIADTKANILLSVNAIIISLLLSNLIPKLDTPRNSYLIYPTVIFVIFSIASIIMSVLATRPKIENNVLVEKDLNDKDTNFLFFGNFHSLSLQDFKRKIRDIINNKESIYDSLTMDLYFLGLVLKQKYRLLRWTYTVFIIGIVLSVIAFAIALKYYGMDKELLNAVAPK